MPSSPDQWRSLRVKPTTHQKFKELAARRGGSIDDVASQLVKAALHPSSDPFQPGPSNPKNSPGRSPPERTIDQINAVARQCASTNWDGYEALLISRAAKTLALRFAKAFPPGLPPPSIGAEPDGSLTFEWHRAARRTLSISLGPDGHLHYAALLGPSKRYGSEPFNHTVPEVILNLIAEVERPYRAGAA